jgi:putative membrane protein
MKQDRNAYIIIGILSLVVFAFLTWLIYLNQGVQVTERAGWTIYLPEVNAFLNFVTSMFLIAGYKAIKAGKKEVHIRHMLTAVGTSALFLVSYVIYHYFQGDTKFTNPGVIKYLYFFILISHILLSIVNVPAVFGTLYHAGNKNYEKHKKWAKWTFPVWLYVSVTGVLVYIFLKFLNG